MIDLSTEKKRAKFLRELTALEEALDDLEKGRALIANALIDFDTVGFRPLDDVITGQLDTVISQVGQEVADREMICEERTKR